MLGFWRKSSRRIMCCLTLEIRFFFRSALSLLSSHDMLTK
uniref:Uncharacterized protein n=1 Tax=Anguilla anguilla TaxID=7936 RepID=A0A0E9RHG1_ANGAN